MRDPAVTALPKVLAKAAALDTASIEVLEPSTGTRICLNMVLTPSGVRWWSGLGRARQSVGRGLTDCAPGLAGRRRAHHIRPLEIAAPASDHQRIAVPALGQG